MVFAEVDVKYWNKDKHVRERCWTKVSVVDSDHCEEKFLWCQRRDGGKFYRRYYDWWFERAEDAAWFILRWQ